MRAGCLDDPYEPPPEAEITLDTVESLPEENAQIVLSYLAGQGYIRTNWREV